MNLQKLFLETLSTLGFSDIETNIKWELLHKNYSKKNRYYHNWIHIEAMIKSWLDYKNQLQNPVEVLLAIYYHDVIYVSTSKNNELKSAELACKQLKEAKGIDLNAIYSLILCTQTHNALTNDEEWMIDFDLQILGKDWGIYTNYYKQIRKEYRIYPNFMYNPGRKKALQHFLEKEYTYQTSIFRDLFENQARENIQKEIALL
jgi:predicted metal-dependent HD superfamily phosphohydrolase